MPRCSTRFGARRVRLQAAVGRQIHARKTPVLEFRPDDVLRSAERIDQILRDLHQPAGRPTGDRRSPGVGRQSCTAWPSSTSRPAGRATTWWPRPGGSSASGGSATPAPSTPTPPASCSLGVGVVTRLLRFLSESGKRYTGEVVLGVETDTLDAAGDVVATYDMDVTEDDVRRVGGRAPHRPDPAGAADGVGPQGRRAPAPRAGPRGHRGGAGGTAGHGAPLRRRGDADRRSSTASTSSARSGTYVRSLAADLGHAARRRRPPASAAADRRRFVHPGRGPSPRAAGRPPARGGGPRPSRP